MARKLTSKQEAYKNARISGVDPSAAYDIAYDHKMSRNAVAVAAQKLERHPKISLMVEQGREEAADKALVTTEDVVKGLLVEAQCNGEGSSQSARVAAWKALSDFTGGFDTNKQKVQQEVTGKDGKPIENKFTVEFVNAAPKS
jgi:phage terminase small subunit